MRNRQVRSPWEDALIAPGLTIDPSTFNATARVGTISAIRRRNSGVPKNTTAGLRAGRMRHLERKGFYPLNKVSAPPKTLLVMKAQRFTPQLWILATFFFAATAVAAPQWVSVRTGGAVTFTSVWGFNSADVWVVGYGGYIQHWDGRSWTQEPSGTTTNLQSIWGTNSNNLWCVGDNGTVLRRDASGWHLLPALTTWNLSRVWGVDSDNVWIVGVAGVRLKWNGSSLVVDYAGGGNGLRGLWGVTKTTSGLAGAMAPFANGTAPTGLPRTPASPPRFRPYGGRQWIMCGQSGTMGQSCDGMAFRGLLRQPARNPSKTFGELTPTMPGWLGQMVSFAGGTGSPGKMKRRH
jgi:hypothetical protein